MNRDEYTLMPDEEWPPEEPSYDERLENLYAACSAIHDSEWGEPMNRQEIDSYIKDNPQEIKKHKKLLDTVKCPSCDGRGMCGGNQVGNNDYGTCLNCNGEGRISRRQ